MNTILTLAIGSVCYAVIAFGVRIELDQIESLPRWYRVIAGIFWPLYGLLSFGQWIGRG